MRYAFGSNWKHFVQHAFDEDRLAVATSALLDSLGRASLAGLSFLDIGSGSGLHSLAAHRAGADRVISFDYDPDSVEATMSLRRLAGSPDSWSVERGDVLDRAFLASLPPADVVYSWGVLHHTGQVWQAIENAASLIRPDGVALLALYASDVYADPAAWLELKRSYNLASPLRRRLIEARHLWAELVRPGLRRPRQAWATVTGYYHHRGMSYLTDLRDWLGGWPMEFCGAAETRAVLEERLGLEVLDIKGGNANYEYLVRPRGALTAWGRTPGDRRPLVPPFAALGGCSFAADLGQLGATVDPAAVMAFENGRVLGPRDSGVKEIARCGAGGHRVWQGQLVFSTADGSDPNHNGRAYSWGVRGA